MGNNFAQLLSIHAILKGFAKMVLANVIDNSLELLVASGCLQHKIKKSLKLRFLIESFELFKYCQVKRNNY